MAPDDLPRRLFFAANEAERRAGRRVTLEEWGARVADEERGRAAPYAPAVVGRWLKAQQEPASIDQRVAFAKALGVDPGWLYFGSASAAPAPEGWAAAKSGKTAPAAAFKRASAVAEEKKKPKRA